MRLRVVQAPDTREAILRIRADLGADALVLATREVEGGVSVTAVGEPPAWYRIAVDGVGFHRLHLFVAGIAVWLQAVIVLFGPKDLRFKLMTLEWPEDVAAKRVR